MAQQMSQCNLLILLLPPNIAVLTSSAFCLITQCYYLGAWKTPVWMTEVYRITSMIHFCGNSHIVCTDQLQLFTYTLLLAFREKGRERKAGRTVLLAHFPYHSCTHGQAKRMHSPSASLDSTLSTPAPSQHHCLQFCEVHGKKIHRLNPKTSTFRPIISQAKNLTKQLKVWDFCIKNIFLLQMCLYKEITQNISKQCPRHQCCHNLSVQHESYHVQYCKSHRFLEESNCIDYKETLVHCFLNASLPLKGKGKTFENLNLKQRQQEIKTYCMFFV